MRIDSKKAIKDETINGKKSKEKSITVCC